MKSNFFDGIRAMLEASSKTEEEIRSSATLIIRGMEQKQAEFKKKQKEIENDIRRGSNLSRGKIPL
ncbi:hypothetical protein [Oxalobacter paraformigenes]|uniref:Uncharacterized protein n=1 Tax=Oxalobacter paraformigenes TaxID=556268 RepID=T5LQF9_9BURK|nr:hypothetical protein [Oxalobacter paraformigenes]EQM95175.1 hypothetical protein OFAG_02271 [Oxalobacter paraformigenes]